MAALVLVLIPILLLGACAAPARNATTVQWIEQSSGTQASLRGLCVVSETVAWASGTDGTCLRTVDGGNTWQARIVLGAQDADFRDVEAVDESVAWLLRTEKPARIYHTADGGDTWTLQYEDVREGAFLDSLAFWDERSGVAFGDPVKAVFTVLLTNDGGRTWNHALPADVPLPVDGEAGFAASGTCIAVQQPDLAWIGTGGAAARILRSTDRGQTWEAIPTPMRSGTPSRGTFSVAFRDRDHGLLVGGDYREEHSRERNVTRTGDGGLHWQLPNGQPPLGYRSCVAPWPRQGPTWIAVGPTGADQSHDDGRSWQPCGPGGYHTVAFAPTGAAGWAVGAGGKIAKLTR